MAKNRPNVPNATNPTNATNGAEGAGGNNDATNADGCIDNPGGDAGETAQPCEPEHCTITSQTVHTSPGARSRTRIGVGERVSLTVSPAPATWSADEGGTLSSTSGETVEFTAGDVAANVTIKAETASCSCSITLEVVAPTGVSIQREPTRGTAHTRGNPSVGFVGRVHLLPDDVNFDALEYREDDVEAVGDAGCSFMTGQGHHPNTEWLAISSTVIPGRGSRSGIDIIGINMQVSGTLSAGTVTWSIPWNYRVNGGTSHHFATIDQVANMDANGAVSISKGGDSVPAVARNAATSTMDTTPPVIEDR